MDTTPNLALPYIMAAQAQKHVTHNEALRELDAIVQLMVLDKDLATPPGSPANGARYIVAASPTGAWSGQAAKIAAYQDSAWAFYAPQEGWLAWVGDENAFYAYDGAAWSALSVGASVNPVSLVGVNATADTTDRLSVSSPASLFSHEGAGHQQKINKNAAGDTASLLFQTGFSGRAEMGTTGDDNFHFKVSPDGSTWNEAIVVDKTAGSVSFPKSSFALCVPGGRLTLATGTPVMTSSQVAKTTLYYTPYTGLWVPVYDGTRMVMSSIGSELSLALNSNSGHTGYHQSGKNYDFFYAYVSGTFYFGTGPAWTNDTTRSAALAYLQGVLTNSGTMTLRYGTSSGLTVSVPANQATYLGTVRMSADGQTRFKFGASAAGGDDAWFGLWNMYNRVVVATSVKDSTNSWSYNSGTFQAANASTTNRISFIRGLDEDAVDATYLMSIAAASANTLPAINIGLDSTSAGSGIPGALPAFNANLSLISRYVGIPGLGWHFLQAVEKAVGTFANTPTFYGDAGDASAYGSGLLATMKY